MSANFPFLASLQLESPSKPTEVFLTAFHTPKKPFQSVLMLHHVFYGNSVPMQTYTEPHPVLGHTVKARGGVRPQISDFIGSCAEFCDLSGGAIENPQFLSFTQ